MNLLAFSSAQCGSNVQVWTEDSGCICDLSRIKQSIQSATPSRQAPERTEDPSTRTQGSSRMLTCCLKFIFIQSASYFSPWQERENRAVWSTKKVFSDALLLHSLLLFFLFNWPVFFLLFCFFSFLQPRGCFLKAIKSLSLTWFLDVINSILWLTGCFVYYSCFFA